MYLVDLKYFVVVGIPQRVDVHLQSFLASYDVKVSFRVMFLPKIFFQFNIKPKSLVESFNCRS